MRGCSSIASYKFHNAGLGNRAPRPGRPRTQLCSLCFGSLDELHVAFTCPVMEDYRNGSTDIEVFKTFCRTRGILPRLAFKMYLTGLDWKGLLIPVRDYLKRGIILKNITNEWLRRS